MEATLLFDTYKADMISRRRAPRSVESYEYATTHFRRWLAAQGLRADDVRRPHIQLWLHETGWAPSTQKVAFAWVRAAYSYAFDEEMIERNPCRRVRLAPIPERVPRTLTMAQLRELEARCRSNTDLLFLRLFSYTGARSVEVRRLRWNDVDLAAGSLLLHGKGDRDRLCPLHPRLRECLREEVPRSPWVLTSRRTREGLTDWGLQDRLGRLGAGMGIQKHDFRRTVATNLRRNGADRTVIKSIIGHSRRNEGAWASYDAADLLEMQRAILLLYVDDPI